jgi:hypothetical protein
LCTLSLELKKGDIMNPLRIAPVLVLFALTGIVAPLSAAEPATPAGPPAVAAPEAGVLPLFFTPAPKVAAKFCPSYYCPIYYPDDCSCDWILCPDGSISCGVWNGAAAMSRASGPPPPPLFQF